MPTAISFIRYWGSHFKSRGQVDQFIISFGPLLELGWKCILVLERLPENLEWTDALSEKGIQLVCIARPKGNFDPHNVRAVRQLCLNSRCEVFHCDNMHTSPLIGAAWAGVPVRVWCKRAMNSHYEQGLEPGWREWLAPTTRLSVAIATCVIAVSGAVAGELLALGAPREKVVVLNNPRPQMRGCAATRESGRAALAIPQDARVVVAVGRVERVKGWDVLIEAFSKAAGEDHDCRLLLVGTTEVAGQEDFKKLLDGMISATGLTDRIHFTGHVTEVKPMLLAADIFALPSRSEGCCNALLEALEAGLPFVATEVGSAREVLDGTRAGIVVPRCDPAAFADALEQFLKHDGERAEVAARARIPDDVLDRQGHARRIATIYQNLLPVTAGMPVNA